MKRKGGRKQNKRYITRELKWMIKKKKQRKSKTYNDGKDETDRKGE